MSVNTSEEYLDELLQAIEPIIYANDPVPEPEIIQENIVDVSDTLDSSLDNLMEMNFSEQEISEVEELVTTEENIELVANVSYELTFAIVGLVLFIFMKVKGVKFELPKQGDKAIAAVCETAGQLTYVYAMSGNGAIAAPILSSVCVVSLLLSRIFLKEKLTKKQYLFIGIIIVGILMLAVLEGE